MPTSIISGLNKTSAIQQSPFIHFYSAFTRNVMDADVIYIIGSGLSDLHVNAWLREARLQKPKAPLLFIDYWKGGLPGALHAHPDQKLVEMIHALRIPLPFGLTPKMIGANWIVANDKSAAVWDDGFTSFLSAPSSLSQVLDQLASKP